MSRRAAPVGEVTRPMAAALTGAGVCASRQTALPGTVAYSRVGSAPAPAPDGWSALRRTGAEDRRDPDTAVLSVRLSGPQVCYHKKERALGTAPEDAHSTAVPRALGQLGGSRRRPHAAARCQRIDPAAGGGSGGGEPTRDGARLGLRGMATRHHKVTHHGWTT
jgi:hypothetical protein